MFYDFGKKTREELVDFVRDVDTLIRHGDYSMEDVRLDVCRQFYAEDMGIASTHHGLAFPDPAIEAKFRLRYNTQCDDYRSKSEIAESEAKAVEGATSIVKTLTNHELFHITRQSGNGSYFGFGLVIIQPLANEELERRKRAIKGGHAS